MCATWTTVSSASRARHSSAAAPKARGFRRRLPRKSVCNPVNEPSLLQEYTELDAPAAARVREFPAGFPSSAPPTQPCPSSKLLSNDHFPHLRLLLWLPWRSCWLASGGGAAQTQKPLPLKPDQPGMATNHRLILKDGSYQVVRKYEIVGDRVRYISVERGGDWEELPVDLVDWEATRKWERDHASQPEEEASPAMKEAEEIDKEEAAERDEQKAAGPRSPRAWNCPTRTASLRWTPLRARRSWSSCCPWTWP
jgi:hypothetical protein